MEAIREWLPPLSWGNTLVSHGSAIFMMIGGVVPYIPQYLKIREARDSKGFSLFVCLALLVANILRIYFWFCVRFETPLLIQSIIMTVAMLLMIELCTRVNKPSPMMLTNKEYPQHSFRDMQPKFFWKWTDFSSYVECIVVFMIVAGAIVYFFKGVSVVVEIVGSISTMTEAVLGLPQFVKNYRKKSTKGMSTPMVVLWMIGDLFKTIYFIFRSSPVQFIICGLLQVVLDTAILFQLWYYRDQRGRKPSKALQGPLLKSPHMS